MACLHSILLSIAETENTLQRGSCVHLLVENSTKLTTTEYLCIDLNACSRYSHQSETGASGGSLHIVYNELGIEWTSQDSQIKPKYRWIKKHRRKSLTTEHAV